MAGRAGSESGGGSGAAGGASPTTGLDPSKRLDMLSPTERVTLCDFNAAKFGGYGKKIECGGGRTISGAFASQAECLAEWPTTCAVTVATYEQCFNAFTCDGFPVSCGGLASCQ
jgi:hypothetical protein